MSQGKKNEHKQAYVGFLSFTHLEGPLSLTSHGIQLAYGLHFLFRLRYRAQSYDERLEILKAKGLPHTTVMLAARFKKAAIDPGSVYSPECLRILKQWHHSSVDCLQKPWTDRASDTTGSGPYQMWGFAHRRCYADALVYQPGEARLRRLGYVLWDAPTRPFEGGLRGHLHEARRQDLIDHIELEGPREQMWRSWNERTEIHKQGGRGYWSEGDLSRTVWNEEGSETSAMWGMDGKPVIDSRLFLNLALRAWKWLTNWLGMKLGAAVGSGSPHAR